MSLAARFVLPLSACPSANAFYAGMHWAKRRKLKQQTLLRMLAQGGRRSKPLPGKPLILAVRESSQPLDADQERSWLKVPLDCLKADGGLGFIRDDAPGCIQVQAFWKKAPPRKGQCVIELWEDENAILEGARLRGKPSSAPTPLTGGTPSERSGSGFVERPEMLKPSSGEGGVVPRSLPRPDNAKRSGGVTGSRHRVRTPRDQAAFSRGVSRKNVQESE